jgi:predicted deacylase
MHTAERLRLARLPSGIPVETTVHTYGEGDPTVYVQAAQHGHEVNGTEVLRRVHHGLVDGGHDLAGTLVTVPVADPLSFDHVSYTTPPAIDARNANMNRVWPGDPDGSVHERMAARLWTYAASADAVVDLHTGSPEMLTHTVYRRGDDASRALALAFGTDVCLAETAGEDADDEWTDRGFDGKFRVAASAAGIPAITPELAHNKQLVEPAVEAGVEGVFDVLRYLDLLPGDPDTPADQRVVRNHLGRVAASASGLFRPAPDVELGAEVAAGDHLGHVTDPTTYEVRQRVEATHDGLLYSITRNATVSAGQKLVGIALPLDDAREDADVGGNEDRGVNADADVDGNEDADGGAEPTDRHG